MPLKFNRKLMRGALLLSLIAMMPIKELFAQKQYVLKNDEVEFSIDEKGNILTLKRPDDLHNYAGGGPVWRLYYDGQSEKDIEVLGKENRPEITQNGNEILLHYDKVSVRNHNVRFELLLTITLEAQNLRSTQKSIIANPIP